MILLWIASSEFNVCVFCVFENILKFLKNKSIFFKVIQRFYLDKIIFFFSKGFYEEAVALLKKAIKGEKQDNALYSNRGGKYYDF